MVDLRVEAIVPNYEALKSRFEAYHSRRAEYGGESFQLFRTVDDPNRVVALIEFDEEANARA